MDEATQGKGQELFLCVLLVQLDRWYDSLKRRKDALAGERRVSNSILDVVNEKPVDFQNEYMNMWSGAQVTDLSWSIILGVTSTSWGVEAMGISYITQRKLQTKRKRG